MSALSFFDADLHLHGPQSTGVSKNMSVPVLAEQAQLKGLHILGTGDILSKLWLNQCEAHFEEKKGVYTVEGFRTNFILSTEVNDSHNVHHLIYFPNFEAVHEMRKILEPTCKLDGPGLGRPHVRMEAEKLAEKVMQVNGIIGPAHAYTPYFSIYSRYDSLQACYGMQTPNVKFMELGLSADTDFSDQISGNHTVQYLTNSDSHSPWPERIGREFTRYEMAQPNFKEFKKAIYLEEGRKIAFNVGLDPREGKYHCTACNGCYAKIPIDVARSMKMKCPACKEGIIKRGVRDLIQEKANIPWGMHPKFRPKYIHIVPLAELIKLGLGLDKMSSPKVQTLWREFVHVAGSEIQALIDTPIEKLATVNEVIAGKIHAFRNGWVLYIAGGGGNYGVPVICNSEKEVNEKKKELNKKLDCASAFQGQKTLGQF